MTLKHLSEVEYEAATGKLTFVGSDAHGQSVSTSLVVSDPEAFLALASAAHFDKSRTTDDPSAAFVADALQFAIQEASGRYMLSFRFFIGDLTLSVVAGIHARSEESVESIKAHLEQALIEMQ